MNADQKSVAQRCLDSAYAGSRTFPEILNLLHGADIEGYIVDYRRGVTTYYAPDGSNVELANPGVAPGPVEAAFNADIIISGIRDAQTNAAGYTYKGFCEKVVGGGCAGYHVSLSGRRAVYFGRTAETHVEHFPA